MNEYPNANGNIVVINRGEEVIAKLTEYARANGLKSAWMSGLGGASGATLGFYDIDSKDYEWHDYDRPMEILNLSGNLSVVDGQPFWHIHGNFSGRDTQGFGGHVKSLTVGLTCEVLVTPLDSAMTRTFDQSTGLKLLDSAD